MLIKDIEDATWNFDPNSTIKVLDCDNHFPAWYWWVVIGLLWFPALLILLYVGCTRKKYNVSFSTPKGTRIGIWVDEDQYNLLLKETKVEV